MEQKRQLFKDRRRLLKNSTQFWDQLKALSSQLLQQTLTSWNFIAVFLIINPTKFNFVRARVVDSFESKFFLIKNNKTSILTEVPPRAGTLLFFGFFKTLATFLTTTVSTFTESNSSLIFIIYNNKLVLLSTFIKSLSISTNFFNIFKTIFVKFQSIFTVVMNYKKKINNDNN